MAKTLLRLSPRSKGIVACLCGIIFVLLSLWALFHILDPGPQPVPEQVQQQSHVTPPAIAVRDPAPQLATSTVLASVYSGVCWVASFVDSRQAVQYAIALVAILAVAAAAWFVVTYVVMPILGQLSLVVSPPASADELGGGGGETPSTGEVVAEERNGWMTALYIFIGMTVGVIAIGVGIVIYKKTCAPGPANCAEPPTESIRGFIDTIRRTNSTYGWTFRAKGTMERITPTCCGSGAVADPPAYDLTIAHGNRLHHYSVSHAEEGASDANLVLAAYKQATELVEGYFALTTGQVIVPVDWEASALTLFNSLDHPTTCQLTITSADKVVEEQRDAHFAAGLEHLNSLPKPPSDNSGGGGEDGGEEKEKDDDNESSDSTSTTDED